MPSESASTGDSPQQAARDGGDDALVGGSVTADAGDPQPRHRSAHRPVDDRLRALVEHGSDLIAIVSDGIVTYASPSHESVLGRTPASLVGGRVDELVHPDDVAEARRLYSEARAGQVDTLRMRHADGSWRSLSMSFSDLRSDPAVGGIVINSRDVTAERELEAQLRQAQQMEALGLLAGGVAHDFNNVLAVIEGFARLLHDDLPEGDRRRDDAAEILRASARGAAVARQLLAFSRRRAVQADLVDLADVVDAAGQRLRATLPADISLVVRIERGQPVQVLADRAQLEQVLLNVVDNAREAMDAGAGGELTIGVAAEHDVVAPMAVLIVGDSGVGMSADVRARAFEPFFTTKEAGRGNGLGLATVYGLVRQFGGTVTLESTPGLGTRVTVRLPLAPLPHPSASTGDDGDGDTAGERAVSDDGVGCTVMLVDDEPGVRDVTRRMLERRGYGVLEASHGAAALASLEAGARVDLLLTDSSMPVMGGRELASALARQRPELPVVLMSGYTELVSGEELPPLAGFLEKPFSADRLAAVLARARQRGQGGR